MGYHEDSRECKRGLFAKPSGLEGARMRTCFAFSASRRLPPVNYPPTVPRAFVTRNALNRRRVSPGERDRQSSGIFCRWRSPPQASFPP